MKEQQLGALRNALLGKKMVAVAENKVTLRGDSREEWYLSVSDGHFSWINLRFHSGQPDDANKINSVLYKDGALSIDTPFSGVEIQASYENIVVALTSSVDSGQSVYILSEKDPLDLVVDRLMDQDFLAFDSSGMIYVENSLIHVEQGNVVLRPTASYEEKYKDHEFVQEVEFREGEFFLRTDSLELSAEKDSFGNLLMHFDPGGDFRWVDGEGWLEA